VHDPVPLNYFGLGEKQNHFVLHFAVHGKRLSFLDARQPSKS